MPILFIKQKPIKAQNGTYIPMETIPYQGSGKKPDYDITSTISGTGQKGQYLNYVPIKGGKKAYTYSFPAKARKDYSFALSGNGPVQVGDTTITLTPGNIHRFMYKSNKTTNLPVRLVDEGNKKSNVDFISYIVPNVGK